MLDNEQFKLLALTLDAQTLKTTIKLKLLPTENFTSMDDMTNELAGIGSVRGTGSSALNR